MTDPTPEQLAALADARRLRDTLVQMCGLRLQRTPLRDLRDFLKGEATRVPQTPMPVVLDTFVLAIAGAIIDVAALNRRDREGAALQLLERIARHTQAGLALYERRLAEQDAKAKGRDAPVTLAGDASQQRHRNAGGGQ